jgi:hypothetical protein
MTTTHAMSEKGQDFVAGWADAIARKVGISVEYVAQAAHTVGVEIDRWALYRSSPDHQRALDIIGSLTPDQAKAIAQEMRVIEARLVEHQRTCCHYCGLPLKQGRCEECS